jgi:hypothetical protein
MSGTAQFVDATNTPLNAANLNTLLVSPTALISGGIPSVPGGLVITQPATVATINPSSGVAVAVSVAATTVSCPAGPGTAQDVYVDLLPGGTYTPVGVAHNAGAPALSNSGNCARLYFATTNAGNTAVSSITALMSTTTLVFPGSIVVGGTITSNAPTPNYPQQAVSTGGTSGSPQTNTLTYSTPGGSALPFQSVTVQNPAGSPLCTVDSTSPAPASHTSTFTVLPGETITLAVVSSVLTLHATIAGQVMLALQYFS